MNPGANLNNEYKYEYNILTNMYKYIIAKVLPFHYFYLRTLFNQVIRFVLLTESALEMKLAMYATAA